MKHFQRTLAAVAVGAALAAGPGIATAGAIGVGYLGVFDLKFYKTDGTTQSIISAVGATPDITAAGSGFQNSGDTTGTLNGVPVNRTGNQAAGAAGFDVAAPGYACSGAGCNYTNNTFTYLVKPADVPGASYALSDVQLLGAAIDLGQGAVNVGADAQVLSESAVVPDDTGSAQGNLNLNARFTFVAEGDFDLAVDGSFDAYLRAALIGGLTGIDANAQIGWEFSIREVATGITFGYSLDDDDDWDLSTISASSVGDDFDAAFSGDFAFDTIGSKGVDGGTFFVTGNEYQVTVTHQATADSQAELLRVPEPATLALVGMALLGLGVSRRRNRT